MKRCIAAALAILLGTAGAFAQTSPPKQTWPPKTVRIIVPFGAGSTPDVVARLIANRLQQQTGATFLVEDKPGASGNTGTDAVAKAVPDGTTIGISIGGPLAINTLLFTHLSYDPNKDLSLITMLVTQPSALAVNANLGVNSVPALLDLIKKSPGKYNYGSIGTGSLSQLAMEAIAIKSGTKLVHVPYPSSPQAVQALIRGDVQMVCLPAISITPQLKGGKIKLLAISTAKRSPLLPGVPTLDEFGIDVEADAWMGLIGPAGLSTATVERINRLVAEAITSPAIRDKLSAQLMEPIPDTPAQFRARIEADIARWKPVIAAAKIKIN
ncbi:MAG: Bug family tripartite tricarboxylate transporter substrate binding protein [Xanthobacteraceae bacterium]